MKLNETDWHSVVAHGWESETTLLIRPVLVVSSVTRLLLSREVILLQTFMPAAP